MLEGLAEYQLLGHRLPALCQKQSKCLPWPTRYLLPQSIFQDISLRDELIRLQERSDYKVTEIPSSESEDGGSGVKDGWILEAVGIELLG